MTATLDRSATSWSPRFDGDIDPELLEYATPAELAAYKRWLEAELLNEAAADRVSFEGDWREWLRRIFPDVVTVGFAPHHEEFWEWAWSIEDDEAAETFVAIWPRGGAKSTSAELACVALGARGKRRYGLYVSGTQSKANDHVTSIEALLGSPGVGLLYPRLAERAVGEYGQARAWRRNRLWTRSGFIVDAVGLDTDIRGLKLEQQRPDFIVLDDVDAEHDGPEIVDKKITTLTHKVLPAGAPNTVVLAIQNLVHPDSVFARLVDGRAEYLTRRHLSGPVPAVDGLEVDSEEGRFVIVDGTATWAGQDLDVCQGQIDLWGITAFRIEAQHEVDAPPGGMFDHLVFDDMRCSWDQVPWRELVRAVVWVDPSVTETDDSDACGIQADALGPDGTIYRLRSWERRSTPLDALCKALEIAEEIGAEHVGVETDQGGEAWNSVWREACEETGIHIPMRTAKASGQKRETTGSSVKSKAARASRMLVDYERGNFVHVEGTHPVLERALRRFPKTAPHDLTDAAYWGWADLRGRIDFVQSKTQYRALKGRR